MKNREYNIPETLPEEMKDKFLLIRQSSSIMPDLDDEEEKLLILESQGSFEINDEFEPKVPPLSKQSTNFKS